MSLLLDSFVADLAESEPPHRAVRLHAAGRLLEAALAEVPDHEQLAMLLRIRQSRAAEIEREMKREDGRWLRGLQAWIEQRGWLDRPAAGQSALVVAPAQDACQCLGTGLLDVSSEKRTEWRFCSCAAGQFAKLQNA